MTDRHAPGSSMIVCAHHLSVGYGDTTVIAGMGIAAISQHTIGIELGLGLV